MKNDSVLRAERESIILRLVWTLLLALVWQVAELVLLAVVLVQFGHRLIRGRLHAGLRDFGDSLGRFLGQGARYLTFASERKPWPFAPWPKPQADAEEAGPKP